MIAVIKAHLILNPVVPVFKTFSAILGKQNLPVIEMIWVVLKGVKYQNPFRAEGGYVTCNWLILSKTFVIVQDV